MSAPEQQYYQVHQQFASIAGSFPTKSHGAAYDQLMALQPLPHSCRHLKTHLLEGRQYCLDCAAIDPPLKRFDLTPTEDDIRRSMDAQTCSHMTADYATASVCTLCAQISTVFGVYGGITYTPEQMEDFDDASDLLFAMEKCLHQLYSPSSGTPDERHKVASLASLELDVKKLLMYPNISGGLVVVILDKEDGKLILRITSS